MVALAAAALASGTWARAGIFGGDANLDGKIDVKDAILVLKYVAGLGTLTNDQFANADINADGKVGVQDVLRILRLVAGIIGPQNLPRVLGLPAAGIPVLPGPPDPPVMGIPTLPGIPAPPGTA
ncbi:MAG TPA: dockerin type I repeat-containing protein [Armatimonadota bacterium]